MDARRIGEVEIREAEGGPHLYGVLIQEGRAARRLREVFAPGSVQWPSEGVGVLLRHHAAPEVRAIPERQPDGRITLKARATEAIRQAVEGGRRFMSVEFHALRERRTEGGIREVLRALVPDVALVDAPEYGQTAAEVRRGMGRHVHDPKAFRWPKEFYRSEVEPKRRRACRCTKRLDLTDLVGAPPDLKIGNIVYRADSFDDLLKAVQADADAAHRRNVQAILRGSQDVIADTSNGSLRLSRRPGGGLRIDLVPLDTQAGRRVGELVAAGVPVYPRIVHDWKASDYELAEDGETLLVTRSIFSYLLVRPVDPAQAKGLDALKARKSQSEDRGLSLRRRLLLAGAA